MRWPVKEVTLYRNESSDEVVHTFRYYPELSEERIVKVSTSCSCNKYVIAKNALTVTVGKYRNSALIDVKTNEGITYTLRINVRQNPQTGKSGQQLVGKQPSVPVLQTVQQTVRPGPERKKVVLIKRDARNILHE